MFVCMFDIYVVIKENHLDLHWTLSYMFIHSKNLVYLWEGVCNKAIPSQLVCTLGKDTNNCFLISLYGIGSPDCRGAHWIVLHWAAECCRLVIKMFFGALSQRNNSQPRVTHWTQMLSTHKTGTNRKTCKERRILKCEDTIRTCMKEEDKLLKLVQEEVSYISC